MAMEGDKVKWKRMFNNLRKTKKKQCTEDT